MTDRQRIVEVIAYQHFLMDGGEGPDDWRALVDRSLYVESAERELAALEAAGWAWYRRDGALPARAERSVVGKFLVVDGEYELREYRLVPVGGDS